MTTTTLNPNNSQNPLTEQLLNNFIQLDELQWKTEKFSFPNSLTPPQATQLAEFSSCLKTYDVYLKTFHTLSKQYNNTTDQEAQIRIRHFKDKLSRLESHLWGITLRTVEFKQFFPKNYSYIFNSPQFLHKETESTNPDSSKAIAQATPKRDSTSFAPSASPGSMTQGTTLNQNPSSTPFSFTASNPNTPFSHLPPAVTSSLFPNNTRRYSFSLSDFPPATGSTSLSQTGAFAPVVPNQSPLPSFSYGGMAPNARGGSNRDLINHFEITPPTNTMPSFSQGDFSATTPSISATTPSNNSSSFTTMYPSSQPGPSATTPSISATTSSSGSSFSSMYFSSQSSSPATGSFHSTTTPSSSNSFPSMYSSSQPGSSATSPSISATTPSSSSSFSSMYSSSQASSPATNPSISATTPSSSSSFSTMYPVQFSSPQQPLSNRVLPITVTPSPGIPASTTTTLSSLSNYSPSGSSGFQYPFSTQPVNSTSQSAMALSTSTQPAASSTTFSSLNYPPTNDKGNLSQLNSSTVSANNSTPTADQVLLDRISYLLRHGKESEAIDKFKTLPEYAKTGVYGALWAVRGKPKEGSPIHHINFGEVSFLNQEERCASTPQQKAAAVELYLFQDDIRKTAAKTLIKMISSLGQQYDQQEYKTLFASLPLVVQNAIKGKHWEICGSPTPESPEERLRNMAHQDFGRVSFLGEEPRCDVPNDKKIATLNAILADRLKDTYRHQFDEIAKAVETEIKEWQTLSTTHYLQAKNEDKVERLHALVKRIAPAFLSEEAIPPTIKNAMFKALAEAYVVKYPFLKGYLLQLIPDLTFKNEKEIS